MAEGTIKIAETRIGTPDSGIGSGLNLCTGLELFPPFPTIPVGWMSKGAGALKVGHSFSVIAVRASAGGSFGLQVGLCGPSYAIKFDTEGEVQNGILTLTVKDDEAMGGAFCGCGLQAEFELKAELYKVYWHWGPHGKWSVVLNVNLGVGIDALKAAVDIIMAVAQVEDMLTKATVSGAVETPLAMVGESSNAYAENRGVIEMDCVFTVPINLWTICVVAAYATVEIPYVDVASAVIIAVHEVLDVTLSSLGFGPTIGFDVPVNIQIQDVSIDNVRFNKKAVTDGKWIGELADKSSQVPAEPKEIKVTLVHNAGFDLRIGLYAELQLLELFHVGASIDMGILGLFNIVPKTSDFTHSLMNTIGKTYLAAGCDCSVASKEAGLVYVQFI